MKNLPKAPEKLKKTSKDIPKTTKAFLLAVLTDAGLLKPLYYFLVSSAVVGTSVGLSKVVLEPNQEQQRKKIQVILQPPTSLREPAKTEGKHQSTSQHDTRQEDSLTTADQTPINTNRNHLEKLMKRIEEALREDYGLYWVLEEAEKEKLSRDEMKALIAYIIEITDESYPLNIKPVSSKEQWRQREAEEDASDTREKQVRELVDSILGSNILHDPIFVEHFLETMEQRERANHLKIPHHPDRPLQPADHRFRETMIRIICGRLEQATSDHRSEKPKPSETIRECRRYLDLLRVLGLDREKLQRYERRLQNVS